MPKAEKGTPKYIANKMKAKGLQKLRWYCQMCQKQCRDENGFKCHTTSESHQRQLLLFSDNSKKIIDDFSYEFAYEYLQILRRQFGTKRVNANRVYQEYIADRNHVHMNATRWVTLSGFVKWAGRAGKCLVEETEKGWFITYIDRDPDTVANEERKLKKSKMDKDDEEKTIAFIENQARLEKERLGYVPEPTFTDLRRENDDEALKIELKMELAPKKIEFRPIALKSTAKERPPKLEVKKQSVLDEIRSVAEANKERTNRKDYWLAEGIVVKIMTKSLGDEFYKQKAVVKKVENRYVAIVKVLESGKKIKLDQEHLETVLPALGRLVKIVNGAYRGETASLVSIDEAHFCAEVKIATGLLMGRVLTKIDYEDICKLVDE